MIDYVKQIYGLLPKGPIWPEGPGDSPIWDTLINALSLEWARVSTDAARLPLIWLDTPDEFLEDFERLLSLDRGVLTDAQRRAQVNAKLAFNRGINFDDIDAIAAALGATVTQHEYPVFHMNVGAMGDALRGEQWLATFTVTYGGPADAALEAAMLAAAPPNTTVIFVVV